MIRSLAMLMAVFALLLTPGVGSRDYAYGMAMGTALSSHHDVDGCASSARMDGQADRHDAGGCQKMHCCLGTICVLVGLPAATTAAMPLLANSINLSGATASLTGRVVAPPLDPPRRFA